MAATTAFALTMTSLWALPASKSFGQCKNLAPRQSGGF
jgi:hypothetical protein